MLPSNVSGRTGAAIRLVVDASAPVAAGAVRETHQRLLRTEIPAVIAVVALEASSCCGPLRREAGMTLYTTDYRSIT